MPNHTLRRLLPSLGTPALMVVALTMLPAADCNPGGTSNPPPAPSLKITDITASETRAHIGDTITVSWDLQDAQLLHSTTVSFMSPVVQGFDLQHTTSTDPNQRSICFVFQGPVTLELQVDDGNHGGDKVAFDIRLDEAYDFEADVTGMREILGDSGGFEWQPETTYPDLHYGADGTKHLVFQNFAAMFDPGGHQNGYIDGLARFLPTNLPFRADSTTSTDPGFGLEQGSGYPYLTSGFLSTTLGQQFAGVAKADAIVFGGAVAYSGEVFDVKSENEGMVEGARMAERYESIFIELVYASDAAGRTYLADALLGNLNQGLVLSIFRAEDVALVTGCTLGGGGAQSQDNCAATHATISIGPTGHQEISGTLDAELGWPVKTVGGDLIWPHALVQKLTYHMPLYADDDPALVGRIGTTVADQSLCR